MESKTEIIQRILDGLKLTGHGNQAMNKLRKKYLLSEVSGKYKDLQKFLQDSASHFFGEALEHSKQKKADIIVCKHSNGVQEFVSHTKGKLMLTCHLVSQKTTGQPKSIGLAKRVIHKQTDTCLQNTIFMSGKITEVAGIKRNIDLLISQIVSHDI